MADIGFPLNCNYITEVNIDPHADEPAWAWVGPGIRSIAPSKSETSEEKNYYDGGGASRTKVTGLGRSATVTGDRLVGDPFQDFVASLDDCIGDELTTQVRTTSPDGAVIERDATIHNIVGFNEPNGEANASPECSCEFAYNGTPRLISKAAGTKLPESVTVGSESVEVAVGATSKVTATASPEDASQRMLFAVENTDIARVSADGTVRGLKAGKTQLSVKCAAKPALGVVVPVTVTAA